MIKVSMHACLIVLAAIGMTFSLSSCDDDEKEEKFYKVYNTDTGGDVPYYALRNPGEPIGSVTSRTECEVINTSSDEDEPTTFVVFPDSPDTVRIAGKYLFVKKVDGKIVPKECYYVATDGARGGVKVYDIPDKRKGKVIQTIANDIWLQDIGEYQNDMHIVTFYDGTTGWIDHDNLARTTRRFWEAEPGKLANLRGKSELTDRLLDTLDRLQDSHLHYTTSSFWLKVKIFIMLLLFAGFMVLMLSKWDENKTKNLWYLSLPTIALGLGLMYFEFVDAIVMADGYFKAINPEPFNTLALGWFLNLIITIVLGLIYFVSALVVLIVMFILQLLVVPAISYSMYGNSQHSLIATTATAAIMYVGATIALFAGPESLQSIAYITLGLAALTTLYGIVIGLRSGNYQAILAVALPALYIVSIAMAYFIAKAALAIMAILAVAFLVSGSLGHSSKFQSQGSGKSYRVVGQDGQTKGYVDDEGFHN